MSQSGHFVTIQVKKRGQIDTATLGPPQGLGGRKITISSGDKMSQWT
jgi:hypothetical protein